MQIVEITPNIYGGHANQTYNGVLPDGWAFIPDEMGELENFPFGSFEVEEVEGVPYMKTDSWVPGEMPEPEPEPEPADPGPTLDERVTVLEESNAEMTEALDMILSGVTE